MRQDGEQIHMDVDEARAASTPNVTRWVLTFGGLARSAEPADESQPVT